MFTAMQTYKTDDVYGVTRDLPLTYVERENVDAKLIENISRDKHIVIFGSSKQGKTCLRKHCLQDNDYLLIQCQNDWPISRLCESLLKGAGYRTEISTSKTSEGRNKIKASIEAGFKVPGFGGAKASMAAEEEEKETITKSDVELEIDPADPNDIIRALSQVGFSKYIVLEDFHYLPQETQESFSFILKTFHEISKYIFIVVAVWREENRLIVYNGDLSGRVISVDADEWSVEELKSVVSIGEGLLNIKFNEEFIDRLITASFGSVYLVQEALYRLCRESKVYETQ